MANPFVHVELATTDLDKAKSFYQSLFDWQLQVMDMGGGMSYTMIGVGEGTGGGMMKHPVPGAPSAWLAYVLVDDVTAVAAKSEVTTMRERLALPEAGSGPGLLLLAEADRDTQVIADLYAAEGYVVLCAGPKFGETGVAGIAAAVAALRGRGECTGKVGMLGVGGRLAWLAAAESGVDCAIVYHGAEIEAALDLAPRIRCPLVMHFAGNDSQAPPDVVARLKAAFAGRPEIAIHVYPGVGRGFNRSTAPDYDRPAAGLAHSRSIALLRRAIGPHYDLEALWDKHTLYEFGTRDVAATMQTMVAEPYVNHIPVMTGGVGHRDLARFYENHFIPKCPKD